MGNTVDTKEVVTAIAYLIGVRKHIIEQHYRPECGEVLDKLYQSKEATVIRYLCKLRTALLQKFKKTDEAMLYNLKNLNSLEWFDQENIKQLEKWDFQIIRANYRSEKYMQDFTKLINENIDKCMNLFHGWINWDYIRDLFFIPKYSTSNILREEFNKYMANIDFYPFQLYIHWKPADLNNILSSDRKFLKVIYSQHNDTFTDFTKYKDADDETKNNIYQFIQNSEKTAIAVDCENSDVFKLYSVLKSLNQDELARIEKITLYDDSNTTSGWDWLSRFISIPTEHIEVERVTDRKSLVDIKMTASVCKDYYESGVTSFIIVSSDSDFWGLISSLPNVKFLVMYEYEKCGTAIKNALSEHGIYHCAIDDFCTSGTDEIKKAVLFEELERHFPSLYGTNAMELTKALYENTKIKASEKEIENFCTKFVKTLRLKVNAEGNFIIEIQT
ncbi:MAG: NYN domain-containing protein [Oscillospiraceae bacterium]|nr:NYN domain-containing protein [Oscillospiraceae bacterium]